MNGVITWLVSSKNSRLAHSSAVSPGSTAPPKSEYLLESRYPGEYASFPSKKYKRQSGVREKHKIDAPICLIGLGRVVIILSLFGVLSYPWDSFVF